MVTWAPSTGFPVFATTLPVTRTPSAADVRGSGNSIVPSSRRRNHAPVILRSRTLRLGSAATAGARAVIVDFTIQSSVPAACRGRSMGVFDRTPTDEENDAGALAAGYRHGRSVRSSS